MTPDVNVLVAASRSDHPCHATAKNWLEQALDTAAVAPLVLQPMVIASYLRLVTNPRIFVNPTPIAEAMQFLDALLDMPGVSVPELGAEWPVFRTLCLKKNLSANQLPDAWLAAVVIEQGEHLASFDRDFKKLLSSKQFTRLE
jgi:toxin-antitoxin system PIN domain toxin